MFGSNILDVAFAIVFVFCLLSLVATSIRELIEGVMQMRAVQLERGLREILDDPNGTGVTTAIYDHPLVASLFRGKYNPVDQLKNKKIFKHDDEKVLKSRSLLPAYIPARNFALALMDFAGAGAGAPDSDRPAPSAQPQGPMTIESLRAGIAQIPSAYLRKALNVAVDQADDKLEQVRENLEDWFNSSMERVSGWYRKHTQWILLWIGVIMAIGLNVNTLDVARTFQNDTAVRNVIIAEAQAVAARAEAGGAGQTGNGDSAVCVSGEKPKGPLRMCAQDRLESLPLPFGWNAPPIWLDPLNPLAFPWLSFLANLAGWLLTAIAISLGAPFWFDLLNRLMVIRSTIKPNEKSTPEAPKDPVSRRQR